MNEAWMLTFAAFVPFLALGLVMWLARLEDTLGEGIEGSKAPREAAATVTTAAAAAATTSASASPEKAPTTAVA